MDNIILDIREEHELKEKYIKYFFHVLKSFEIKIENM